MEKPKLILFDYGHTIMHEAPVDPERGWQAVLQHATRNPRGCTAAQAAQLAAELNGAIHDVVQGGAVEISILNFENLLFGLLEIELDISLEEASEIYWRHSAPAQAMPGIAQLLDYLHGQGIRTGIISNLSHSTAALRRHLDRLVPNHGMAFIIGSSECVLRKPSPYIFRLALTKADLPANAVWHCGDSVECDVMGAAGVGIFPVWFHSTIPCPYRSDDENRAPSCEHLYIREWSQLQATLEGL